MDDLGDLLLSGVMLLTVGIALRMSMRLLYGARGPSADDVVYFLLRILSWAMLIVPAWLLVVAGANVLSLILLVLIIEATIEFVVARRESQRQGAWRVLTAALEKGRVDPGALAIHSPRFKGVVGRAYRGLLGDLAGGIPWTQALVRNRRAVPREAIPYAMVIEGAAGALDDAGEFDDSRDTMFWEVKQQIIQRMTYLGVISFTMLGVVTFVMIKIIPSYQEIFDDFDLELPSLTLWMIYWAGAFEDSDFGVLVFSALSLALLAALLVGVAYLMDLPLLRPLGDRIAFSRHRAMVMRLLAAAFARGKTVSDALEVLTHGRGAYPSGLVRRKLAKARRRVDAGEPWHESLRRVKLISRREEGVLGAAEKVGNLPWALRMLAARRVRVMAFRWSIVQHFVFTAIILALGAFVFVFSVAMVLPLVDMVNNLTY